MKRADIQAKMLSLVAAMREEEELKAQLLHLDFSAQRQEDVERAYRRQRELVGAIESIRAERVLPIVSEVACFLSEQQKHVAP